MSKMNIAARRRARRFALQALYQWHFNPDSASEMIAQFLGQPEMVSVDTDFFQQLVQRIIRQSEALDEVMHPFLKPPGFEPEPVERAILRIGVYEMQSHPETAYRIIVNEAIELAKTFGREGSYRYINGVLHRVAAHLRSEEIDG